MKLKIQQSIVKPVSFLCQPSDFNYITPDLQHQMIEFPVWKPGTILTLKGSHPNLERGEQGINGYSYSASMSVSYYNL